MANILEIRNIYREYGEKRTEVIALKELSSAVQPGEFIVVIGPSGSNRSTLLTITAGSWASTSNGVVVDGRSLNKLMKKRRLAQHFQKIGFILQNSNLMPFLTVEDQFYLTEKIDKLRKNSKLREQLLETLSLKELQNSYPHDLSDEERQRVAIACALYYKPDIVLADEPTTSLDTEKAFDIVQSLAKEAGRKSEEIIVMTHDERLLKYCDRVVRIRDSELVE